ncbi:MAG: putative DNA binding domain-containing protein [Candidatus Sumerlaeota bacterium]|nr:putative DNA binding domain-containing protein [Candidatus Sumerlaeota bacterium]
MDKESEQIENKQSLSKWREVVESVAAFATSKGGCVHIGVDPKGEHIGLQIGHGTLEDLANKIKMNTDPSQYPSIAIESAGANTIIIVRVEESPIKPVWAFGRPLKRVGRTNQHLAREEAHRLMEATTGRTWDALACHGFIPEEMGNDAVRDFLRRAGLEASSGQTLLSNLGLLTNDGIPCNGAALLFASYPQRFFPEAQVKCARFAGTTSVKFIDEKTFDGVVLSQLDNALAFVARNTRQAIRITGKAERDTIPEYPDEAVREAIINAICHRDYAAVGTIQVRIYDDRLEVWNPGILPPDMTFESLTREHASRPRNPRLAQAFYRARLIEHWGTGILRMMQSAEDLGIKLELMGENGVFITRFHILSQLGIPREETPFDIRQRETLEYIKAHGKIANREYQTLFGVGKRQALKDLLMMVNKGALASVGQGRALHYITQKKQIQQDGVRD